MATNRITKEILFLRYEFSQQERLDMGAGLATAYNRMAEIEDEEAVMKSQIKDRKTSTSQTIGTLSRNLGNGYELRNIPCDILYDTPNVGEVSFRRQDTGEVVKEKTRRMTEAEMQMDLPLAGELIVMPPAQSAKNIGEFFGVHEDENSEEAEETPQGEFAEEPEEDEVFTDPDPSANKEAVKAENDEAFGVDLNTKAKPGRKPKGFAGPTNSSAISDF